MKYGTFCYMTASKKTFSPHALIQEELADDPWKMLVACMLLNQTSYKQVRPIIWHFFDRWPEAKKFVKATDSDVVAIIRTLGFQNRRAKALKRFSLEWINAGWRRIDELHGIGKYAADSYRIFILGEGLITQPTDRKLLAYVNWLREQSE